jgi:viroplasmin and RNaseH domain-containing protein
MECKQSVSGFPGAKFHGYATLSEAKQAWAERDG